MTVDVSFPQSQLVDCVDTPIDRGEVRRYLGYPRDAALNPRIEGILDRAIAEASYRARPRAIYAVFPVADIARRSVRVGTAGGSLEFKGAIAEFLGPIDYLAVFIATAGPQVEALATQKMRDADTIAGLIINAVGSERAEAAELAAINDLRSRVAPTGRGLTLPYSPGYCGMAITEQRTLFSLVNADAVGVSLTPECLMHPIKSVSGLIGIGPAHAVEKNGSPCDRCELKHCNMRR